MAYASPRLVSISAHQPLWLALLATPLFVGQAMAAPEVISTWDGKPVAEALALNKGTVT